MDGANGSVEVGYDVAIFERIQTIQSICYTPLVLFGIFGNSYVIIIISRVFLTSHVRAAVYVYVLCLSLMDLTYLIGSVMLILNMAYKTWFLGFFLCKIYWITESFNKTYSVYILVILSIDRYRAISRLTDAETRNFRTAVRVMSVIVLPIMLVNMPIYVYSVIENIGNYSICRLLLPTATSPALIVNITNGTIRRYVHIDYNKYYTIMLFVVYFVIPCSLIVSFYTLLLLRLKRPTGVSAVGVGGGAILQRRLIRSGKVVKSIMLVVMFYLLCWTPYWLFQIAMIMLHDTSRQDGILFTILIIQIIVYSLPYINSALNPILYGILNRSLRRAYRESMHRYRTRRIAQVNLESSIKRRKLMRRAMRYERRRQYGEFWKRLRKRVPNCKECQSTQTSFPSIGRRSRGSSVGRSATEATTDFGRAPEVTDSGVYDVWASQRDCAGSNIPDLTLSLAAQIRQAPGPIYEENDEMGPPAKSISILSALFKQQETFL